MKKYFAKIKGKIIILSVVMLVGCGIDFLNPIVNANLLTSITDFNMDRIKLFVLLWLIISIVHLAVGHIINCVYFRINENILYYIRKDMINSILRMKIKNFDKTTSGEFQERLRHDPEEISSIFSAVQYSAFSLITDIFILGYIYYINIFIGLVFTIGIVVIWYIDTNMLKKYRELMKETRAKREKNNTIVNEIIRGIRDIKLLNISRKIANIAAENLDNATKLSSKTNIYSDRIFKLVDLLKYIITFVVIMLSVLFVNKGILTVTSFLVIFMYRNNIYDMVLCITTLKKYSEEYKLSKERIFKIIDSEDFPHEESSNVQLENVKGDISFRNVSFAYNKKVVLKNINFKVKNKELVAIVGKSGSGKSTIFNLLTKAYDIPDNMIFIDGIDINELDLNTIRSNIAVVSQTPYIFNMSIKDNLKLIDDDVTMDDIKRVCHLAELDDFINGLPDKYDTIIGEGGVNLSGGERQRLAIARAILKKSPIILLDEATSALDNVTQNKIQQTINNLMEEYTVIVIAHRLSTIKGCSKIMVIDDGHVVGMGTHKKLLKSNKVYQQLYKRESEM